MAKRFGPILRKRAGADAPHDPVQHRAGSQHPVPGRAPQPPRPPRPPVPVRQAPPAAYAAPPRTLPVVVPAPDPQPPRKQKAKRSGGWRIVFTLAILVLICALGGLGWLLYTYWNGQNEYDKLAEETFEVHDAAGETTLGSFDIDWDALRAVNPDVVGWVYVPDTVISYPICWRADDSTYYLKHNFGQNSVGDFGAEYGCVFLEGVNDGDWTDQVNVIYGHHMANGSMFALLADFAWNSDLFNQHRTFYVLTPEGNFKTTSFAVNKVRGTSTDIVIPTFDTEEGMRDYVQARLDANIVEPADPPAPAAADVKQVFAFSTCSEPDNQYRIITFCTVDEFLPAGSDEALGNSLVSQEAVDAVEGAVAERVR